MLSFQGPLAGLGAAAVNNLFTARFAKFRRVWHTKDLNWAGSRDGLTQTCVRPTTAPARAARCRSRSWHPLRTTRAPEVRSWAIARPMNGAAEHLLDSRHLDRARRAMTTGTAWPVVAAAATHVITGIVSDLAPLPALGRRRTFVVGGSMSGATLRQPKSSSGERLHTGSNALPGSSSYGRQQPRHAGSLSSRLWQSPRRRAPAPVRGDQRGRAGAVCPRRCRLRRGGGRATARVVCALSSLSESGCGVKM